MEEEGKEKKEEEEEEEEEEEDLTRAPGWPCPRKSNSVYSSSPSELIRNSKRRGEKMSKLSSILNFFRQPRKLRTLNWGKNKASETLDFVERKLGRKREGGLWMCRPNELSQVSTFNKPQRQL